MDQDRRARVAAARRALGSRHAKKAAAALLALAGCGQAAVQAAVLAAPRSGVGSHQVSTALATEYALPLCLLALLATVPIAVYRPVTAALVITFGNAVALASADRVTVAGAAAELFAACVLGVDGARAPGQQAAAASVTTRTQATRAGKGALAGGSMETSARYLAVALAAPFLAIAVSGQGGDSALLLASGVPIAAGAGITAWASRQARTGTAAGQALADTMLAHTARGERARIARELHDVVAHHISMIAVQAEAGRLATPGLPEAGARRFAEIGDTARAGLTEMRRLLGVLRDDAGDTVKHQAAGYRAVEAGAPARTGGMDRATSLAGTAGGARAASRHPQPGLGQLAELIDAARGASMSGIRLIISGQVATLDPGVELAAYRIVQEALTNARRHAPGAAVDVQLGYAQGTLRLRVRDNGPGPGDGPGTDGVSTSDAARGGHGLPGMRERALSVGGSLYTGAAPSGGFLVDAVLPAESEHARAATPGTGTGLDAGLGANRDADLDAGTGALVAPGTGGQA